MKANASLHESAKTEKDPRVVPSDVDVLAVKSFIWCPFAIH
jgi:hypothetical protein